MCAAHGGFNHQAAGEHLIAGHAQQGFGLIQHRIHKPAVLQRFRRALHHGNGLGRCLVVHGLVDHALLEHGVQDVQAARVVVFFAHMGRVVAGCLDAGRQRSRLRQRQVLRVHAKIGLRRGLNPVGPVAKINVVEIHGQNFVLAHLPLQIDGQPHLLQLAGNGLLRAQMALADQLHGDGACALGIASLAQIGRQSAKQAHEVNAMMVVESQVLCRQKHLPRQDRYALQRDDHTVFRALNLGDQFARIIIHPPRLRRGGDLAYVQRLPVRYVKGKVGRHQPDDAQARQHSQRRAQAAAFAPPVLLPPPPGTAARPPG